MNLQSITETSADTYAIDTNDVPLLNEGINGTAKHVGTSQNLLDDESRAWDEGLLEDIKYMRDALVSMRDMFDRRDRYARDNIPQLEKRIQTNEQKLQGIKAKGDTAKPGEAEKVENAIVNVSVFGESKERDRQRADSNFRINNRSLLNTLVACSSRSASAMKYNTSMPLSITCLDCTRTGRRSA